MKPFKFMLKYIKRHVGPLIATVVSMLALVGVQLFAPWIIREMIAIITGEGAGPGSMPRITNLAILALEGVARRDLSPTVKSWVMNAGALVIFLLIGLVLYSDISKLDFVRNLIP